MISSQSGYSDELILPEPEPLHQSELECQVPEQKWADTRTNNLPSTPPIALSQDNVPPAAGLRNQESAYPSHPPTNNKLICFACNTSCSSQSSLSRHQREQCDQDFIWNCPLCEWTGKRLPRHYTASHGDQCTQGCSKTSEKVCDACKPLLRGRRQKLPAKKALGCPYCSINGSCFDTVEQWTAHCVAHHGRKMKQPTWSFAIMIRSLLLQPRLANALPRYDWKKCDWEEVNDKSHPDIKEVLERCSIPATVQAHDQYRNLKNAEAVVRYVFYTISTGHPLSTHLAVETRSSSVPQHAPLPDFAYPARTNVPYPREPTFVYENQLGHAAGGRTFRERLSSQAGRKRGQSHAGAAGPTLPSQSLPKHAGFDATYQANPITGISNHLLHPHAHTEGRQDTSHQLETHPPMMPQFDNTMQRQRSHSGSSNDARRHGLSLRRSFSGLSLRTSSSKEEVPPVPAVPEIPRSTESGKAGASTYFDDWNLSYTEVPPTISHQSRPMSGVEGYQTNWYNQ